MTKKSLCKVSIVFISGLIFLFIFSLLLVNSASATERECPSESFCLEINRVIIQERANDIISAVSVLCRKWRGRKAYNLHLITKIREPGGLFKNMSRRLHTLGEGEKQQVLFSIKNAKKGKYCFEFIFFDSLSSVGKQVLKKEYIKK